MISVSTKMPYQEIRKRTCEVNRMAEHSFFIFTSYVKTVPVYDFKLVWVVPHSSVKEIIKMIY